MNCLTLRKVFVAMVLTLLLSTETAHAQRSIFENEQSSEALSDVSADNIGIDDVDLAMQSMSLRARVSQLMMVTMSGLHGPTAADLAFIQSYTPGVAVIRQILQPEQAVLYSNKLRAVERGTGIPLLVGANLNELLRRDRGAPSVFAQFPSLLAIAAIDDDEITAKLGEMMAQHLKLMGFHLHLGPSLDLAPELSGAQGGIHHFGHDPEVAARAIRVLQQNLWAHDVEMMPMNFPGGGTNREGRTPAVLLTPREMMASGPLRPYAAAIQQGARILHVGNTLVPTLDPDPIPASLSPVVLRDMLRIDLKYDGVIVAGPMDTEDIARQFDTADAALLALRNGADMVYWRGSDTQVMRAVDRIVQAVNDGIISETAINSALRRVLAYKEFVASTTRELPTEKKAAALVKQKRYYELAYEVERRAITLVQNRDNVLPLSREESTPVGITGVTGVDELYAILEKPIKQISQQRITTARHIGDIQPFEINRVTSRIRGLRTIVCILTDTLRPQGQLELVQGLRAQGARLVVVLIGYPTHLPLLQEADAIVVAYSDGTNIDATIRAIAEVLLGEGAIQIAPAREDLVVRVGEQRVYDALDVVRAPIGQLPMNLSEFYVAGLAVPYNTEKMIRRAQWDFGNGKRSRDLRTTFTFDAPGRYPVSLTITDQQRNDTSRTFYVVAE